MIFSDKNRVFFSLDDEVTEVDAKRSLGRAYDDLIDAGISIFEDERLSKEQRNAVMKAVAFSENTIDEISDALGPLDVFSRGFVLSKVEDLLRESVAIAHAQAFVAASAVIKANQTEAMRAAKTTPERERAIEEAIACSDPLAKKRVNQIIADVAKAGFTIRSDAVRERIKKAGS